MIKHIRYCDVCGKEMKDNLDNGINISDAGDYTFTLSDICFGCAERIEEVLFEAGIIKREGVKNNEK